MLRNITCSFEAGKTTAIVGAPGCGKSTIAYLIERFYEPTSGEVYVDGKVLNKVKLRDMRLEMGFMHQDPAIYNLSVASNVAIAKPEATEEEITAALKVSGAWDAFVEKLPHGRQTVLSEDDLSHAEKQMIQLARIAIKKPKILIIDDVLSSVVKAEEETALMKAIENVKAELDPSVTVIIISAHFFPMLKSSDRIFVMKKGEIISQGTHHQLVLDKTDGGIYAAMV